MRLIDADALMDYLQIIPIDLGYREVEDIETFVEHMPTIEPERKKGKWIVRETVCEDVEARCSCCGFSTLVNEPGNGLHMIDDLNFCPNCGADMRGEQDGCSNIKS